MGLFIGDFPEINQIFLSSPPPPERNRLFAQE